MLILGRSWSLLSLLLFLCGVPLVLSLWDVAETVLDPLGGSVELVGTVTGKWVRSEVTEDGVYYRYNIQVEGRGFGVDERVYNWVKEDEEIIVTFWPRTKVVAEVSKLGAEA